MKATIASLWFVGGAYLVLIPVFGLLFTVGIQSDPTAPPEAQEFGVAMAVLVGVISVPVAVLNFAAAVGLARQRKWAWFVAMGLALLYAPSICLPFGVVMLMALLNAEVRREFGVGT